MPRNLGPDAAAGLRAGNACISNVGGKPSFSHGPMSNSLSQPRQKYDGNPALDAKSLAPNVPQLKLEKVPLLSNRCHQVWKRSSHLSGSKPALGLAQGVKTVGFFSQVLHALWKKITFPRPRKSPKPRPTVEIRAFCPPKFGGAKGVAPWCLASKTAWF